MKIYIIYPKIKEILNYKPVEKIFGIKSSALSLAVPTLAALTPPEFSVEIIDENVKSINFETDAEIIAIS